jgi:hypothetical protein
MKNAITPETVAAMARAQGIELAPQGAEDGAKFAALVLEGSAQAFAGLAFEDEPAGYVAAKLRNAP